MNGTTATILGGISAAITVVLGSADAMHVVMPGWVSLLLAAAGAFISTIVGKTHPGNE